MREVVIKKCMNYIHKKEPSYNEEKLEIIQYGLESIYILITKTVFIFTVAMILGILKEVLLFTLFYNIIRMPSFGLHATKSWICLVSSTIIFLFVPYLCTILVLPSIGKGILGSIAILLIFKNAPADTYKRPIIDPKRRRNYKIISTILAIIMAVGSILISNNFISNSLLFSLITQCFMISPTIYKIFHLPYDNYKTYLANNPTLV